MINIHTSDLPGWSFLDDGLMDNSSRGGAFSGAGPGGAQSAASRKLVDDGIAGFSRCMGIRKSLAYEWMGITQQVDLIARVHTGDFLSPDKAFSISSETGVALSELDARYDSRPYFLPQRNKCITAYLTTIAPAVNQAHVAFGDPVSLSVESVTDMALPKAPAGERVAGYLMNFSVTPVGKLPDSPAYGRRRLRIYVAYVTAARYEVILFAYAENVPFPATGESHLVAGIQRRVHAVANTVFRSTRVVHGVTTGPPGP